MHRIPFKSLLFFLLLVSVMPAKGIETVIIQNVDNKQSLGYQLQYIFDASHQLQLGDILNKKNSEWNISNQQELNFGFKEETLWVRFRLKNYSQEVIQKVIVLPYVAVDEMDVHFIRTSSENEHYQGGFRRPFEKRQIKTKNFILPIIFSAKETVDVYIQIRSEGPLSSPVDIWSQNKHYEHQQNISLMAGILYGAMIIMLLYNLFVYRELKEISYLYLSFYIISLILVDASITSIGFQYLWSGNLWFEEKSFTISLGFLIMFASLFVSVVIDVNRYLSQAIKTTIALGALLVVISLIISYSTALKVAVPISIISGLVAVWVVIDVLLHGDRTVKYLVIGWAVFLLSFFIFFLAAFNIVLDSFFVTHGIEFGAVFEILFLTLALVEKINQANIQRDEALNSLLTIQQQTTSQLETRVKDRTSEIEVVMLKLEKANKKLKALSFVDGLTEINNRTYFDGVFEAQWKNAQRSSSPLALLFLDLDHFKRLNDLYGHLVGDQCLKLVATAIKEQVVRETDIVARYGGEEFIVLLPHASLQDAELIAEKIRKAVARLEPEFNGERVSMTTSVGVAGLVPESGKSSHDLIRLADLALYKAKKEGRNQVIVATEEMAKNLEEITK